MDEETLRRAREPFFTTKGIGKGTGLGLSMVHGLAEQFGGTTEIASRLGEGTTVAIILPVAADTHGAGPHRDSDTPLPLPILADDKALLRVLLVDDDHLVLTTSAALLEAHGFEVTQASGGIEALKLVTQRPFDVIVTDQMMPEMTGLQLARAIEALVPDMPIVLASGFSEAPGGLPRNAQRLAKPFRGTELLAAINHVLPETLRSVRSV
jgi:CheY-like chemotaxis protein